VLKDARAVYAPGLSERTTGGSPASKFYHTDALGSTRGITNGSQTVTDAILYDAFGMTVSRTGSTATPFGFVGAGQYQSDTDCGLMLLGRRMYDASVGRFISSDPAKAGDNWYAYCEDNPLTSTDLTGLQTIKLNGESYRRYIGDPDNIKGWPHWDGPRGKWIGNDGKLRDGRGGIKPVPRNVARDIGTAIEAAIAAGLGERLIRPRGSDAPPFEGAGEPAAEPDPWYSGINWGAIGTGTLIGAGIIVIGVGLVVAPEITVPALAAGLL
jgi:RHS repeat-associated protein